MIEVVDSHDKKIAIDGIRYTFSTHDVAESYVRHYREIFKYYKFKVVGNRSNYLQSDTKPNLQDISYNRLFKLSFILTNYDE